MYSIWSVEMDKSIPEVLRLCVNIFHGYLFSVSPQLNKYIVFIVLYLDIFF